MKFYLTHFLLFIFSLNNAYAQTIIKGDMNNDGNITTSDVTDIVATMLGEKALETIDLNNQTKWCYNAADYGILPSNNNNTPMMQSLIDNVSASGGGIIFIPKGTYMFKKSGNTSFSGRYEYVLEAKSNVSIIGAGSEKTILKQVDTGAHILFSYCGTATEPIENCFFGNFSTDSYSTGNANMVCGKAFFFQFVQNCVFRDLILKGTIATAMGIDFINNTTIDHVVCIDCGRTYTGNQNGTSGIGIGTGGWKEENLTITNCVCIGCGQYGIFIENQFAHGWTGGTQDYSCGVVISNNIIRNGLNKGIGVRGGKHVIVSNNNVYGNALDGIYLDSNCMDVTISNNNISENNGCGIKAEMLTSKYVTIQNNNITDNTLDGVQLGKGTPMKNATVINQSFIAVKDNCIYNNLAKSINVTADINNLIISNNINIGNNGYYYGNGTTTIEQNNIEK